MTTHARYVHVFVGIIVFMFRGVGAIVRRRFIVGAIVGACVVAASFAQASSHSTTHVRGATSSHSTTRPDWADVDGLLIRVHKLENAVRTLRHACAPMYTGGGVTQCENPTMSDSAIIACVRNNVYPRTLLGQCIDDYADARWGTR